MKAKILGALAAGCAVGFCAATVMLSGGCGFVFLAVARADSDVVVNCDPVMTRATASFPDLDPDGAAALSAVIVHADGSKQTKHDLGFDGAGKTIVVCDKGDVVHFVSH